MGLFRRKKEALTDKELAALFAKHGADLHKFIAANSIRPSGFGGMTHAFSGADGMAYYTWLDYTELPRVRQAQVERAFQMANAGIGEKTLGELCDIADVANMNHLKATKPDERSKHASKVAHVIGEIRNRPTEIIPEEVFYDIVCTMSIRSDEDPRVFDTVTHGQKIEMITKAGRSGFEFFTKLPILKSLLGSLLTSEAAFTELLSGWAAQRTRMEALRAVYGRSSPPPSKTSTASRG